MMWGRGKASEEMKRKGSRGENEMVEVKGRGKYIREQEKMRKKNKTVGI